MCGIAGLWTPGRWTDESDATLKAMCDAIRHRGPDAYGHAADREAGIGLGHRRLAIIDLTPAGAQPMTSRDGRWVLAFNGEIYNFRELRRELLAAGVAFRGQSDTEVLLEGVSHWGVRATVERAAGMFAFALWDGSERVLYLARDRMGEKPLYYGARAGTFAFASELKALRATGMTNRNALDRTAIAEMLRYSCVSSPRTIYEDMRKLPPASIAEVRADHVVKLSSYWSVASAAARGIRSRPGAPTFQDAVDGLESRLRGTVSDQMVSDVPLGALLSGGVDSSLVVSMMSQLSSRPVKTFTIGFGESDYNEATYARDVARHLGTEHTELYVSNEAALEVVPTLASVYDEPFADASQIPTVLVTKMARSHVTVALSGDGGDESFGGYERHFEGGRLWDNIRRAPRLLRRGTSRIMRAVPPRGWDAVAPAVSGLLGGRRLKVRLADRAYKLATLLGAGSRADMYDRFCAQWRDVPGLVLGVDDGVRPLAQLEGAAAGSLGFVEQMMLTDSTTYLPDDVLVKVDRAAMATSLETRTPFLDHRVIEFAWALPLEYKVDRGEGKRLLKALLFRHVPQTLVDRPKMGFGVPLDSWLRGPLREWGADLLSAERLRTQGILRVAPIVNAWEDHLAGRSNLQYPLWNVLMLQSWLEGAA